MILRPSCIPSVAGDGDGRRLVLLYHGDTAGSGGRCIGRSEVPLSASGRQQMETLASAWTYPAPTLLVASSRQRSYAALVSFARRFGRLPQVDARLDEQDFGDWDGEPWSLLHGRGDHGLQQWLADWSGQAPPGGESFAQMAQRCGGWLDETVASAGDDDLLLVASHAGPLRALACHALSIPLQHALLLRMDHAHVSAMRRRRGRFELCYWNASHFEAGLFGDHP